MGRVWILIVWELYSNHFGQSMPNVIKMRIKRSVLIKWGELGRRKASREKIKKDRQRRGSRCRHFREKREKREKREVFMKRSGVGFPVYAVILQ